MNRLPLKSLVLTLVLALAVLPGTQIQANAMIAPANTLKNAPQFDREHDIQTIQTTLESKMLRQKLQALGLSDAEIQTRLAHLSDAEVHQMASQIRSIHPAGNVVIGVLVIALLVVLIIFFVKRI